MAQSPRPTIEVEILPRANGRPICSGCGKSRPGYDRLAPRRFEFVPLWQIAVFFVYALRRVNCPDCGVKVEQTPWSDGKNSLTKTYRWFLAGWAQRLSWQQAATVTGVVLRENLVRLDAVPITQRVPSIDVTVAPGARVELVVGAVDLLELGAHLDFKAILETPQSQ